MATSMRRVSRAKSAYLRRRRPSDSWHATNCAKWSAPRLRLPTDAYTFAESGTCIASARAVDDRLIARPLASKTAPQERSLEEGTMPIFARPTSIAKRMLPILGWLPSYSRAWLLQDILAGVAVWAVMVPEGMAYSGIVCVPPVNGLYTIVPPLIVYVLLGTSRVLVVGPDTATGLISAVTWELLRR